MLTLSKDSVVQALTGIEAKYWAVSVAPFAPAVGMLQIVLAPREGPEPLPGVTDQVVKFLLSEDAIDIPGFTTDDKNRLLVNVRVNVKASDSDGEKL